MRNVSKHVAHALRILAHTYTQERPHVRVLAQRCELRVFICFSQYAHFPRGRNCLREINIRSPPANRRSSFHMIRCIFRRARHLRWPALSYRRANNFRRRGIGLGCPEDSKTRDRAKLRTHLPARRPVPRGLNCKTENTSPRARLRISPFPRLWLLL